MTGRDRGGVYALLVAANLFWAGNYLVGALVVAEISALQLTALRWALALLILAPLALWRERLPWRRALGEWPLHLGAALSGPIAFTVLSYEALHHASPIDTALVSAVAPATIAIGAAVILRERVPWMSVLGIAVSLFGVLLVVTRGDLLHLAQLDYNLGELLQLAAVLCWTAYSLFGRRLTTPPITATLTQALIAAVLLAPVAIGAGGSFAPSALGWLGIAFIVVFPTVLAFILWNLGVGRVGPARAGIFLNLLPVFTTAIGLAFGGSIEAVQLIGGALVIIGVTLTVRSSSTRRGAPPSRASPASPALNDDEVS